MPRHRPGDRDQARAAGAGQEARAAHLRHDHLVRDDGGRRRVGGDAPAPGRSPRTPRAAQAGGPSASAIVRTSSANLEHGLLLGAEDRSVDRR